MASLRLQDLSHWSPPHLFHVVQYALEKKKVLHDSGPLRMAVAQQGKVSVDQVPHCIFSARRTCLPDPGCVHAHRTPVQFIFQNHSVRSSSLDLVMDVRGSSPAKMHIIPAIILCTRSLSILLRTDRSTGRARGSRGPEVRKQLLFVKENGARGRATPVPCGGMAGSIA